MKCLILAAGYATRLYPLTQNYPKPLLSVGEKTILDWLIDDIYSSGEIDEFAVISNHKFYTHFKSWSVDRMNAKREGQKIVIVDDGTETNETRLGAVRDVEFAIKTLGYDDDLLVIAGDNVLDFSLTRLIKYANDKKTSCIMRYSEHDLSRLSKCGVVEVDGDDLVISMEEKPSEPKSEWCVPPFYFYTKDDARKVSDGIAAGCGVDAPGSYISWLCSVSTVHAMEMPGKRYDIGSLESYERVKKEYKGIVL